MALKILMTGASSFLGKEAIKALGELGHAVEALARKESNVQALSSCGASRVHEASSAPPADVLIHLGTLFCPQTQTGDELSLARANVQEPLTLILNFLDQGGSHVICAGSCWEACGPDLAPANAYAASKAALRSLLAGVCAERAVRLTWLRFSDIVGPADPRERLFGAVAKTLRDGVALELTAGEQVFDPVHVADAASAIALAATLPFSGPLFEDVSISGQEPRALREKIQMIFDLKGQGGLARWGVRPYRRGEPFQVRWASPPAWWKPQYPYATIVQEIFT